MSALDGPIALAILVASLAFFSWVGYRAGRKGVRDRDSFLTARGTQGALPLALSFFASGLGAWILFTPPQVGTFAGILGVLGYGLAAALPFYALALLGPRMRARLPRGIALTDFVETRLGLPMKAYVALVSILYMFVFFTAEFTVIGGVLALLAGVDPFIPILAVALATAAYTAYGGLPASLQTDRWQGWMILGLVAMAMGAILTSVPDPLGRAQAAGLASATRIGAESFVVLCIAVLAANLFHQGYWQRVWAARDDGTLVRGALLGGSLSIPVVMAFGIVGMVAAGSEGVEAPSFALFTLLLPLPAAAIAIVVALAIALSASTVDTLQNGLASLLDQSLGKGRMGFGITRSMAVLITIPAILIALQGYSVLRLFLIADLLAAATVVPVFLGFHRRTRPAAALAGAAAGLLAVVLLGWATRGDLLQGLALLTLPQDLDLGAFVVAPLASGVVTWIGSHLQLPSGRQARESRSEHSP